MYRIVDWFDVIRFRWKLVALTTAVLTLVAIVYLAVADRTYQAQASLIVDPRQPSTGEAQDGVAETSSRSIIATQADLIRTPTVAAEASVLAGFDKDPAYIALWRQQTGARTPYKEWLEARLLGAIEVTPGEESNILLIRSTAQDPAEAARVANGFAQAAVSSRYRLRSEPTKAYATWLEGRMAPARTKVLKTQKALSDFVRTSGLSQGEDLSAESSQVAAMGGQLAAAEAAAAAARQSDYAEAQGRGEAEQSTIVQQLREKVADRSAKVAELEAVFGPEYPQVLRARAELATLESRLRSELSNASGAYSAQRGAEAAARRQATAASEARLRALAAEQRKRMQSMGVNVAQYATLKNEFAEAQRNYNELNQRLAAVQLQSAAPQTEVQVLDQASRFRVSSSPNRQMTLALAILLGLLLGGLTAIILELLNPRVRSWGNVERLLGVQVLGRVALPRAGSAALPGSPHPPLIEARAA